MVKEKSTKPLREMIKKVHFLLSLKLSYMLFTIFNFAFLILPWSQSKFSCASLHIQESKNNKRSHAQKLTQGASLL